MTKNEFRALAQKLKAPCSYSGHTQTMFVKLSAKDDRLTTLIQVTDEFTKFTVARHIVKKKPPIEVLPKPVTANITLNAGGRAAGKTSVHNALSQLGFNISNTAKAIKKRLNIKK